jgi:aryl-alcohol dehydrogenase-like predicted oxidoreductase
MTGRLPQRTLGSLRTPILGLGCMGMSQAYGTPDDVESVATIRRALDLGVTFLDTSDAYGPRRNEVLVGTAIAGRRDEVVLATKFGIVRDPQDPSARRVNGRPEYVRASCDESLGRLGVERIDLYYQHRVDPQVPIEETVGAMGELVAAGKVAHLGLSEASATSIRRAYATHPIAALQSEWSLWSRDIEAEVVPTCRQLGVGIVAYSPLGRGLLTGTIDGTDPFVAADFRRNQPRFMGENLAHNLRLAGELRALADAKGCTASQLALAWVLARGDDVVPIPGTKRRTYLEENVAACDVILDQADLDALEALDVVGRVAGDRYADMEWVRGDAPRQALH